MTSAVQKFIDDLAKVRVHQSPATGPSLKKPLLLLLVASKIEDGTVRENRIRFGEISEELKALIEQHGNLATNANANPEEPFFYLHTSPFWRVVLDQGASPTGRKKRPSTAALRMPGSYAQLDDQLFVELSASKSACARVREAILKRWWPHGAPHTLATL